MTRVCENKAKATIFIKFKDGKTETVVIEPGAAEVEVVDLSAVRGTGGTWNFLIGDNISKDLPRSTPGYSEDSFVWRDPCGRQLFVVNPGLPDRQIDGDNNCPAGPGYIKNLVFTPSPTPEDCEIKVKNNSGVEVYKKVSACPVKWNSACENDCPPQHLKCKTTAYPGFKCVPCSNFRA